MYNVKFAISTGKKFEEEILNELSEYEIYAFYLGYAFEVGRLFSSPFRRDLRPSFNVYRDDRSGKLLFKDFGDINRKGDCFKFVEQYKGLNTRQKAVDAVYLDIILNNKQGKKTIKTFRELSNKAKPKSVIQYIPKIDINVFEKNYWEELGISIDELPFFKIYVAEALYINQEEVCKSYDEDPIFIYKVFDKIKAYRPYTKDKKKKWFSNCTRFDIQGWEQLPEFPETDTLIITKSKKDVAVLRKLGYLAIAPSSESTLIPHNAMKVLSEEYGFRKFIVLYDRDDGGMKGARKMFLQYRGTYNITFKFIPKTYKKDVSDVRKVLGKERTINFLIKLLGYEPNEKLTILPTYGALSDDKTR